MLLGKDLENTIIEEMKFLKDIEDCVGIDIADGKGLFIQVVDYGEGMEYFIELNDVDVDGVYEPCGDYNISSPYGDMDMLIKNIEDYVVGHGVID